MANRAIGGGHGAGGGNLVHQLAQLTGNGLLNYIRARNQREIGRLVDRIADNASEMGRAALSRWRSASNTLGQTNPQLRDAANQMRSIDREAQSDARNGVVNERRRGGTRVVDFAAEEEQDVEAEEPEEAEMEDVGPGGGGGHRHLKAQNNEWMTTPNNRWLGPGHLPGWWPNKTEFTLEISLEAGKSYNLLAQNFTVPGGSIGTDWRDIEVKNPTQSGNDWDPMLFIPKSHILQWLEKPTGVTAKTKAQMDDLNEVNGMWSGYIPGRGARDGTIGSIRPWVTYKYTRKREQFKAACREYKFMRIKSQQIIISDIKAWGKTRFRLK